MNTAASWVRRRVFLCMVLRLGIKCCFHLQCSKCRYVPPKHRCLSVNLHGFTSQKILIFRRVWKIAKMTINFVTSVCPSVRPSAWNMSTLTGRTSMKFDISQYFENTRVGTLIAATIYLQLIQNRYMFRSFTALQCSHQHCVQPVASDVEVVEYL